MKSTLGPNFLDLPDELRSLEEAASVIVPVPYDLTSTWKKGADRGPAAIIEASHHIEFYDVATGTEPCNHGIATLEPLLCDEAPEILADRLEEIVSAISTNQQLPIVLGGDHSISIGAIRAIARARPAMSTLQIDAHADTRESYAGSRFNHACVMARAREHCEIVQVGIRAIDRNEVSGLDPERVIYGHQINGPGAQSDWIDRAIGHLNDEVYVTIDLDGFDPAYVPATGTPEPGGLDWYQVTSLLERVAQEKKIVGFDVVELLPTPGQWASEFLAAKLIYRFLAYIYKPRT